MRAKVANIASAAMAIEHGNIARARWHMATSRIIDLLQGGRKQSLVEKMKKNMNNSMLASLAAVNPDTCPMAVYCQMLPHCF